MTALPEAKLQRPEMFRPAIRGVVASAAADRLPAGPRAGRDEIAERLDDFPGYVRERLDLAKEQLAAVEQAINELTESSVPRVDATCLAIPPAGCLVPV